MADDETRGVHLSDKQLVFVFMAATVVAVVVFLFGVLVGRGVHQARGPIAADSMTAAGEVVPDGALEEPPAPGAETKASGGATGVEGLSYPQRLGKTPPEETLKPAPPPVGGRPGDIAPPDVPGEAVAPEPAARMPAAPPQAAGSAPAPPLYTVQLGSLNNRDEADAIVARLKAKGYDAFVLVRDGADTRGKYRVRVGAFKDKRQAELLAERLLREEKRYTPWVTR
jgi:cell division septation protein DedD